MSLTPRQLPGTEASYPVNYRAREVAAIAHAVRGRYSLLVCGLGGSGKSHLLRFLAFHPQLGQQLSSGELVRLYLDCNAVLDDDAAGIFRALLLEAGSQEPLPRDAAGALAALRSLLAAHAGPATSFLLILDRFERIPASLQPAVLDGLRHLRDYLGRRVSYVLGSRTPPPIGELSGEFDDLLAAPSVVWVGPLNEVDAAWNVRAIVAEQQRVAPDATVAALIALSGGYARLLRAATLAWAEDPGAAPQVAALVTHQQVRRVCESLWRELDEGAQEMVRRIIHNDAPLLPSDHRLFITGLLQRNASDAVRVVSPLFAAFVASLALPSPLDLTALESRLWGLLRNKPRDIVAREGLIAELYGDNPDGVNDEALTALAARLRRKLQQAGLGTVEAVRGLGYRFVPQAER